MFTPSVPSKYVPTVARFSSTFLCARGSYCQLPRADIAFADADLTFRVRLAGVFATGGDTRGPSVCWLPWDMDAGAGTLGLRCVSGAADPGLGTSSINTAVCAVNGTDHTKVTLAVGFSRPRAFGGVAVQTYSPVVNTTTSTSRAPSTALLRGAVSASVLTPTTDSFLVAGNLLSGVMELSLNPFELKPVASALLPPCVSALAAHADTATVFVGGCFLRQRGYESASPLNGVAQAVVAGKAGTLARWQHWAHMSSGCLGSDGSSGHVYAIATVPHATEPHVYVGGSFSTAGGLDSQGLAFWNATASRWTAVGVGGARARVAALAVAVEVAARPDAAQVYVAGTFCVPGACNVGVALFETATRSWSGLGAGVYGEVFALALVGDLLVVGGNLVAETTPTQTSNLVVWNRTRASWDAVDPGPQSYHKHVRSIAVCACPPPLKWLSAKGECYGACQLPSTMRVLMSGLDRLHPQAARHFRLFATLGPH